jgi:hypothetical protein
MIFCAEHRLSAAKAFTVVGRMSIPDEKKIQAMTEGTENHPKTLKYVS